jgi:hypothetical protein
VFRQSPSDKNLAQTVRTSRPTPCQCANLSEQAEALVESRRIHLLRPPIARAFSRWTETFHYQVKRKNQNRTQGPATKYRTVASTQAMIVRTRMEKDLVAQVPVSKSLRRAFISFSSPTFIYTVLVISGIGFPLLRVLAH